MRAGATRMANEGAFAAAASGAGIAAKGTATGAMQRNPPKRQH
jgi:hypothetical protein